MNFEMNAYFFATPIFVMGIALFGYAKLWKLQKEKQLEASRLAAKRTGNR